MKTTLIIISCLLLGVAGFLFSGAAYKNYVADTTPIETFEQAGHTWEIRHSRTCKCRQ
jgi:hypothetical protein